MLAKRCSRRQTSRAVTTATVIYRVTQAGYYRRLPSCIWRHASGVGGARVLGWDCYL